MELALAVATGGSSAVQSAGQAVTEALKGIGQEAGSQAAKAILACLAK